MLEAISAEKTHLDATLTRLDGLPTTAAIDLASSHRQLPLAVLDSNVVLDLWYWHDPEASSLKNVIDNKRLQAVSSPSCIKELAAVLSRPHFELSFYEQDEIIAKLLTSLLLVAPSIEGVIPCKDPDDEKFLNLAYEIRADFLFTKDKKVLRAGRRLRCLGTKTMRPADFDETLSFL